MWVFPAIHVLHDGKMNILCFEAKKQTKKMKNVNLHSEMTVTNIVVHFPEY